MARVVVMGAGIGGISQAYELRKELGKTHDIVPVGNSDRFELTPLPFPGFLKMLGAGRLKDSAL